ncbi:DMT family transporter [Luteibaculum oceani]|uniref:DMT family transporter n=1 Tax=Luteibaculum oceani TaxID=1294296 RepID=A0A5C6VF11_9FLAO|nr:DMT family transporter [Luteibaculum oceani]TXC81818.1 DMT family transporter [Luteibaculum oceani]
MKSAGWIASRLGLLAAIWGSSFILIKRGLYNATGDVVFTGFQVGFLRITLAALVLLPFALRSFKKVKKKEWVPLIVAGCVGNGMPALLFAIAQTKINSALAGVLNSLTPFFTLIIGMVFFGVVASGRKYLGVILGLLGAIGLILSQSNFSFQLDQVGGYSLLVLAACLCYASSVNIIKTYLKDLRPVEITSISFAIMLLPFLSGVYFTDVPGVLSDVDGAWFSFLCISILGVCGTALAVILFNHVIKETSALTASSVTYLIPIVAVIWGVVDGEAFTLLDLLFSLVIISGVYLVNSKKT